MLKRWIVFVICLALPAVAAGQVDSLQDQWESFADLSQGVRDQRAEQARRISDRWLKYYIRDNDEVKRSLRGAFLKVMAGYVKLEDQANDQILRRAVDDLEATVATDPSYLEAHLGLAILYYQTGRRRQALPHLTLVRAILQRADQGLMAPYPGPAEHLDLQACIYLAWTHRELGEWQAGLVAAEDGLAYRPNSKAFTVVKCLLLAGAGRGAEANRLASRDATIEFRHQTRLGSQAVKQPSLFAKEWIASQVFLKEGNIALALASLNQALLEDQRDWRALPFYRQYWNDVGLLFELDGDPWSAKRSYDQVARPHVGGFLFFHEYELGPRREPVIGGLPDNQLAYVSAFGGNYLWGSPFSYLIQQIDVMVDNLGTAAAEEAGARAHDMVASLEARGVRPDFCHAARGRLAFIEDDWIRAETELLAAHQLFAAAGTADAGTSLLLGFITLDRDAEVAEEYFRESIRASDDPAMAWRSLAVALGRKGQIEQALEVMATALELDPLSVAGWFNQGILLFQAGRRDESEQSFVHAFELGPDEAQRVEIVSWLQRLNQSRP